MIAIIEAILTLTTLLVVGALIAMLALLIWMSDNG
jgi:hypothetical protein